MTLLKSSDQNSREINVALLSLEADIKNKIAGFDTSAIDKQLVEINSRIDKINAGDNNTSAEINDIRYEIEGINSKLNDHSTKIEDIEKKLSEIFSAENKVTDFNTTTNSGIYYWITDAANRPGNYGVLLVNKYDRGDNNSIWINQVAYDTTNKIYFRQNINSGNWTEWKAVAFEGEMNADTVDNYHASDLWRSDGATWNPNANVVMTPSGNGSEWSFDFRNKNGATGTYWQVWDENKNALLQVNADDGKVSAPYGFVGNLSGKADTAGKASFLDEYPGAGGPRLTSGNIVPKDSSEYGGMRKDVVTDSMTDGSHPGQDGHLLTMFWDNDGRYDSQFFVSNSTPITVKVRFKANEADYGPWTDIITSNNIGSQAVASAGNADTVDNYHASDLWRKDGGTWNPNANISLGATANGDEWSFDISRNGKTGCYWHVWDSAYGSLLKVNADNGKVYAPYGFVGNLSGKADTAETAIKANNAVTAEIATTAETATIATIAETADSAKNMYYQNIDLSSLDKTKFYPLVCYSAINFAEVAICSESGVGSAEYNQNRIHFDISTMGWSDLRPTLNIREYACYDNNEITIGCIGRGLHNGAWAIWLRGGIHYTCFSRDADLSLHTSNYTFGDETYTVGTNYYGGSNTNVEVWFTPQSTITEGAYSSRPITAPRIKADYRMVIPIGAPSSLEDGCIWIER